TLGNIVYLAAQWLISYAVVRVLGFGAEGTFTIATTVGNTACALAAFSMRNYQVSDVDGSYSDRQYILSRIVTSALAVLGCVVFSFFQPYDDTTSLVVLFYSLFKVSEAFSDVYQGIQQKYLLMDYVGRAYILKSAADLGIFVAAIMVTRSLVIACAALALVSFAEILLYERRTAMQLSESDARNRFSAGGNGGGSVIDLLIACIPVAISGVLFNALIQIPRYQLGIIEGDEVLGIYASVAMPILLVQVAANYLFTPLVTPMTRNLKEGNRESFVRTIIRVLVSIVAITALAFAVAFLLGDQAYTLLYGETIRPYIQQLMYPLILSSALTAAAWFLTAVLTILRRLTALLVASGAAFAAALVTSPLLVRTFQMNGATFACIAALLVFIGIAAWSCRPETDAE
ncbi:MAG: hypothetical protein IJH87_01425, partial [Atopobiaceae bacterium]|nr:hypothetical protein [Atopobiaceae bacterium]